MLYYRGCVTRRQILINFCQAIHADEEDPELMAQDFECFPRQWYNEGFISEEDFDHIKEYTEMCEKHSAEAVDDYLEFHDDLDDFEEAYCGEWDSEEDFARHIVEECYNLEKTMGDLARGSVSLSVSEASSLKPVDLR